MDTENSNKGFKIAAIILSYLRGQISEKEQQVLDGWLDSSDGHRRLFEQMTDTVNQGREIEKMVSHDLPEAWMRVQEKAKRNHRRKLLKMVRVAAVVTVLFGAALYAGVQTVQTENPGSGTVADVITPGRSVARLISVHGKVYELDSTVAGVIPNTSIRNGNEIVFRAAADSLPVQAELNKLEIPRGGEYKITLADGTLIYLNSETRLEFPPDFTRATERVVYLTGEAFFQVAGDEHKPFIVKCGEYDVKVLGTSFNVSNYADNKYVHTTLKEGKVEILRENKEVILRSGQQACLQDGQLEVREVNVENYTTWMEDNFRFEAENIEDILKRIARWYVVDVFYADPSVKNYHFSGYLPRYVNIADVLELLGLTTDIHFRIEGKTVVVGKK